MKVAGIAVAASDPKRPVTRVVILESSGEAAAIREAIELPSDNASTPVQLHDTAEALRSLLKSHGTERVAVRRADRGGTPRQTDGPKFRLLMEGSVTSAACSVVPDTRLGTGRETAEWFGASKQEMDDAARALANEGAIAAKYVEATSAALAALALGP